MGGGVGGLGGQVVTQVKQIRSRSSIWHKKENCEIFSHIWVYGKVEYQREYEYFMP